MDENVAFEVLEHACAVLEWTINYLDKSGLSWRNDESYPILRYQISRIQSIVYEKNHPFMRNPIIELVSRKLSKSPDESFHRDEPDEDSPVPVLQVLVT